MDGNTRELLIQLLVGALCAVLLGVLTVRIRRRPSRPLVVTVAVVLLAAIVAIGVLEARVIAAVAAGSALGVLAGGVVALVRARAATPPRILAVAALTIVAALPLVLIEVRIAGESVMTVTRAAAEMSDGSWLVAFGRSWELILAPDHAAARLALAVGWTVAVTVAFAAMALAAAVISRGRDLSTLER